MEIVADHVVAMYPTRSRSPRGNRVLYYYKSLGVATRLALFQKVNEVRADEVSVFLLLLRLASYDFYSDAFGKITRFILSSRPTELHHIRILN